MIEDIASFASQYIYAVVFSAVVSTGAFVTSKLMSTRAYRKRTALFTISLLGSFSIAMGITSACLFHLYTMGYGAPYHVACGDISSSYIVAICTGWVALMGSAFSLTSVFGTVNYYFGRRIVTWLFNVKPLSESQARKLYVILTSLSRKAGIERPQIGLIHCSTPSIFSVGRKQESTIAMSVGLVETLSDDELEASLAHEIAHIKNKDCLIKSLASSLKFAVPFNFLGYLIEPTIHRDREFLADEESAKMTKKPKALISALLKLYESSTMGSANGVFTGLQMRLLPRGLGRWSTFSRHPPIRERLKRLLELEYGSGASP